MAPLSNSGKYDDVLEDSYLSTVLSVSTTAVEAKVGSSPLIGRQELLIYNDSTREIFVGPSTVTASGTTKGITLHPKELLVMPAGPGVRVYVIASTGTNSVTVQELG